MPLATLDRASLQYELDGPAAAPVVVLSNSLGANLSMWDRQIPPLTARLRVLRYDTRGHGGSIAPGQAWSLDDLGADVLALLDLLGIERFHVCGVSLGGITALWLGLRAPRRVLSLMPSNTAARIGTDASWNTRIEQVSRHGLASIASATMERWFTPAFRQREPAQVEATRHVFVRTSVRGYLGCCAALRDADLTASLGSIAAPTTVVSGSHDPVTPTSDGQALQAQIHGARYVELDAAHLSNIEQPTAFADTLLANAGLIGPDRA